MGLMQGAKMANFEEVTCGSCHGTGKGPSCSPCSGTGKIGRWRAVFGLGNQYVVEICTSCGGTGRSQCASCSGHGRISRLKQAEEPKPISVGGDPLVGRWQTSNGYWEITQQQDKTYQITEFGALGRTGTGTAQLKDGQLQVDMQSMLGRMAYILAPQGNVLSGFTSILGARVPVQFTRTWGVS
jgi:hypothetical protein